MPIPDRTTIRNAVDALVTKLRDELVAEPPTAVKPLRRVAAGSAGVEAYPRPFLTVALERATPVGSLDGDRIIEIVLALRLVADVSADLYADLLDRVGAVEDCFDGLIDADLLDGADGVDDRAWSFEYPRTTAGSRVVTAKASQTLIVKVERTFNREPAA